MMLYRFWTLLIVIMVLTLSGGTYASGSINVPPSGPSLFVSGTPTGVPDLIVESIIWSPENPSLGDKVTFAVTVKNQGNGQAIDSNVDFSINDAHVTSATINPMDPGESKTESFQWETQAGDHTIKAVADSNQRVTESDETNNASTCAFSVLAPDLIVEAITWSPDNPSLGDKVTFTVTIKNQGSGRSRYSHVNFYINGADRGYQGVERIEPYAVVSKTFHWTARAGTHEIKAVADVLNHVVESDESNNEKTMDYSTLPPDFVIQTITWLPNIPSEGDNVTFTVTVKNKGANSYSSHVAYYIDDSYLTSDYVPSLNSGATFTTTFSWKTTTSGLHTINVVADVKGEIAESDETNNTKTVSLSTSAPDLIVQSITWSPSSPLVAHGVTFTVTVKNQGSREASPSRINFYIDSILQHVWIEEIGAGATRAVDFSSTAQAGTHSIKAIVDADNIIRESNETNNEKNSTYSAVLPAPPDLVVTDITWSPQNPVVGDQVIFTVTLKNQGSGQASWSDVAINVDDILLTSSSVSSLASGTTTTKTFSWEAQASSHTITAIVDYDQTLAEEDESNNTKTETISASAPDFFIKDVTWSPPVPSPGDEVTFTVTIENRGNYRASDSHVGYFINDSPTGYHYIEELEAGTAVTRTFYGIAQTDSDAIRIVADMENEVSELDENNNEKSITFPLPDIVVGGITCSPENPAENEIVTFSITVKNQSGGAAGPCGVNFYIDGSSQNFSTVEGLEIGATATKTFAWTAEPGSHVVRAVVDEADDIIETSESNNEQTVTVSVPVSSADTPTSSSAIQVNVVSVQVSQINEPTVILDNTSNEVLVGEDIVLNIYADNPTANPIMTLDLGLEVPSGISVTSPEFERSDERRYVASYSVAPGDLREIAVSLSANEEGNYSITGHITHYFTGDESTAKSQVVSLPVTVGTAPAGLETAGSKLSGLHEILNSFGFSVKGIRLEWWSILTMITVSIFVITVFILKLIQKLR